jgi:hypothetical protein
MLMGDACSRPPFIIKSHDLHVDDIRKVMDEITSRTSSFPFLILASFGLPFLSLL